MKKLIFLFLIISIFCLNSVAGFAYTNFSPIDATADDIVKRFGFKYDNSQYLITIGTLPIVDSEITNAKSFISNKSSKINPSEYSTYLKKISTFLKSDKSIVIIQRYCYYDNPNLIINFEIYDFSNVLDLSNLSIVTNRIHDSSGKMEVVKYRVNAEDYSYPQITNNNNQNSVNFQNSQFNFSQKFLNKDNPNAILYYFSGTFSEPHNFLCPLNNGLITDFGNKGYYETFILPNEFAQQLSKMPKLSNLKNFFVQNITFAIETDEDEKETTESEIPLPVLPEPEVSVPTLTPSDSFENPFNSEYVFLKDSDLDIIVGWFYKNLNIAMPAIFIPIVIIGLFSFLAWLLFKGNK